MLMSVMLINSAGKALGVIAVAESDTIVHYGGAYFARDFVGGAVWRGQPMPIFRQPETIYCPAKLDVDFGELRERAAAGELTPATKEG
jgi:hypothetical protein